MEKSDSQPKHFVLVHGACHGAWSWYKLKPRLESAGHRVTAVDLAASGVDTRKISELRSLEDYTEPLLELIASIPQNQTVILVGHSLGGLSVALAADKFPHKVSVAVFLAAFMPDTIHRPSYVLEQYFGRTPAEAWLDTEFAPIQSNEEPRTSIFFGPLFLSKTLYQLSPPEDLALGKMLIKKGSLFVEDLTKAEKFSEKGYGSVKRVYVTCNEDKGIPLEFQKWMIETIGVAEVKEITQADHMPMFSKPLELFQCLLHIAAFN